jgi:hypothetical protein
LSDWFGYCEAASPELLPLLKRLIADKPPEHTPDTSEAMAQRRQRDFMSRQRE